jgi:hypothetical protein
MYRDKYWPGRPTDPSADNAVSAVGRWPDEEDSLFGAKEPFAQTVDKSTIGGREVAHKAIDRFDDDAPLRQTGDGAQRVEARLHFLRHAHAELWIVFDTFASFRARRRAAGAAAAGLVYAAFGHIGAGRRGTVEMRPLRCASDARLGQITPATTSPVKVAKMSPAGISSVSVGAQRRWRASRDATLEFQRRTLRAEIFADWAGVFVASPSSVRGKAYEIDRRLAGGVDRRGQSRSGRRSTDPHRNWRRLAWLFAWYAAYVSVRSLPSSVRRRLKRTSA